MEANRGGQTKGSKMNARITAGKLQVGDKVVAYRDHNTGETTYKSVASIERITTHRVEIFWIYEGRTAPFRLPTYEGMNAVHWMAA
jgi:hypothetical protein